MMHHSLKRYVALRGYDLRNQIFSIKDKILAKRNVWTYHKILLLFNNWFVNPTFSSLNYYFFWPSFNFSLFISLSYHFFIKGIFSRVFNISFNLTNSKKSPILMIQKIHPISNQWYQTKIIVVILESTCQNELINFSW
jgi:hypothetical protein